MPQNGCEDQPKPFCRALLLPEFHAGTTETWFATFYLTSLGKKDGRKYIINIYDCLKKRKHLLKPERFLWCRVSRASATQHGCFQSGCGKHVRAWGPPPGKLQWTQVPGQAKHHTQDPSLNMPESESSGRMLPVSQGPSNQFPAPGRGGLASTDGASQCKSSCGPHAWLLDRWCVWLAPLSHGHS